MKVIELKCPDAWVCVCMFATVCLYLRMCVCLRGCARGNICSLACMCVNVRDNVYARYACSCGAYGCVRMCVCVRQRARMCVNACYSFYHASIYVIANIKH